MGAWPENQRAWRGGGGASPTVGEAVGEWAESTCSGRWELSWRLERVARCGLVPGDGGIHISSVESREWWLPLARKERGQATARPESWGGEAVNSGFSQRDVESDC